MDCSFASSQTDSIAEDLTFIWETIESRMPHLRVKKKLLKRFGAINNPAIASTLRELIRLNIGDQMAQRFFAAKANELELLDTIA
ncbi:hypothetical protein DTL42_19030 [Bremerella cremea]|uniref:Uncharacterized protein n=1 Tax=Bremerella cremea TaxID=1031537 RepID=A0A368KMG6_9BACT|nr:hypothetical protein DTL42_19030 [Bremerella cremea]